MRDHGGNIDGAKALFGGADADWIDLSTGINRVPYNIPQLSDTAWQSLPTRAAIGRLTAAAAHAYRCTAGILPVAGAQAAIQMIPRLGRPGQARVLAPTYNEHAACLRAAGWRVEDVSQVQDLIGADLAVVVNPNNPDGRETTPTALMELSRKVGQLVVDESFGDARPDLSVAPDIEEAENLFVLRSFGKFYGLAGLRLGFVLSCMKNINQLTEMSGPWPVSGLAIEVGEKALLDSDWATKTIDRLRGEITHMDAIASATDWEVLGGTELFRLYRTPDATCAQERLAKSQIWSRIFPWSPHLIRLGLPGTMHEWTRLQEALR
ncbi:threonine-phosphate decarboxylase CobD [Pelagimonas varians]|uniref:threonine-phosphate decarboxylase n=1 Tax=Pelagimonas varians TaxID=696760 RepID=A0A238K6K3_9RHOB|nr:threonine-phosphate decarboxylase CobD [Pelagimonas varians]PYG31816.1 L-threonine O-3-phosphate decarboxylase [Pelagimonas varians]SMX38541.1 Threonine-phosphate decarboxylase [Pelagimonas varians]